MINLPTKSTQSKLIASVQGSRPAIERTEQEKVRIAKAFLEKRGHFVLPALMRRDDVIAYLGCSIGHLNNLRENADFPQPFDINAAKKSIEHTRQNPRWRTNDVITWLESRKAGS